MKTITLRYGDKAYTLEYNRAAVRLMESQGFNLDDLNKKPATTIPDLFAGAFRFHHSGLSRKTIDEIFENTNHRSDLVVKLTEMYVDTINTLFDEAEDGDEGHANWDTSW